MSIIKKAKMSIGVMWGDMDSSQFTNSLAQLLIYSQQALCDKHEYIHYQRARASYHELGRTQLVDEMEGDMLLQLDSDHQFAPDMLERLLVLKKKINARVISGIYCYKAPPYAPVANLWDEKGGVVGLGAWHPDAESMQIGPVGAGCLLTDREVFNEIKRTMRQAPFHIIPGLSEDYSFCKRCKDLKIPIHLALKIQCHHLAPRHVINVNDYVDQFRPAYEQAQKQGQKTPDAVGIQG